MFLAYLVVTCLAIAANAFSATCDFIRLERIVVAMDQAGVPRGLLPVLGVLKAAGAVGLLVGFAVPVIGTAAAVGLVLFFILAILAHLWAGDRTFGLAAGFLALAAGALALGLPHTLSG